MFSVRELVAYQNLIAKKDACRDIFPLQGMFAQGICYRIYHWSHF